MCYLDTGKIDKIEVIGGWKGPSVYNFVTDCRLTKFGLKL